MGATQGLRASRPMLAMRLEKHLPEPRADVKSKVKVKSQSACGPAYYFNLPAQGAKG